MTQIRTTLASTSAAERRKHIIANIGDKNVACAILRCPPFLAAMSPEEQEDFQIRWALEKHPAEYAQCDMIRGVLENVERGGRLLLLLGRRCVTP